MNSFMYLLKILKEELFYDIIVFVEILEVYFKLKTHLPVKIFIQATPSITLIYHSSKELSAQGRCPSSRTWSLTQWPLD